MNNIFFIYNQLIDNIHLHFFAFVWGILVLLSFIGWGNFLKNTFFPDKEIDWGQRAAWGVAWSIFIGGLLNLFWLISPVNVEIYITLGILFFFILDSQRIKSFLMNVPRRVLQLWQKDKIAFLGIVLIIICITFYYSIWIFLKIKHTDDLQAYAVFPQKMLEQGSISNDPFSDRRTAALGGQSFLHTFILIFLQIYSLRIIDPGIAYIISIGLLWGLSKVIQVPRKAALLIIFFLLLIPPLATNTSSLIMGLALFLALFRHLGSEEDLNAKEKIIFNLITALLAAAICASKSNLILFCGMFFIVFYLFRLLFQESKKDTLRECLEVIFFAFIFLLPWMISSLQSSGTMLYPLLGRGYHRSAYGFTEFPALTWASFVHIYQKTYFNFSTIFLIILYLVNLKDRPKNRILLSSTIFFSVLLGLLTLHLLEQSMDPRYSFSFFYASLTMLMMYALSEIPDHQDLILKRIAYTVVLLSMLFFLRDYLIKSPINIWANQISLENLKPVDDSKLIPIYSKAQSSIPPGQALIEKSIHPYLLNYKRNPIYIVDFLILGPKPGMPVFQGGEAVSKYLLSQGIRYVLYERNASEIAAHKEFLKKLRNPKRSLWVWQQWLFILQFEKDIEELEKTRRKIYNDRKIVVIDLNYRI